MKLHSLSRSKGLHKKSIRVGRWDGSGRGNYSGKWLKGQKARSGAQVSPFFEWGQTPLIQKMPKQRGFKRYFKLKEELTILNLAEIERNPNITDTLTKEVLIQEKYISDSKNIVKILWNGDLSKKLKVSGIDKLSVSAKSKIESVGWTIEG